MTETNPFAGIKLDVWYKTLIPLGGVMTLISLFYSPEFIEQIELFVLGLGIFLIGLGEWKNQKYRFVEAEASAFTPYRSANIPIRKPDALGIFFDILGIIAVVIAFANLFDVITWLD